MGSIIVISWMLVSGAAHAGAWPRAFISLGREMDASDRDELCRVLLETLVLSRSVDPPSWCGHVDGPHGERARDEARSGRRVLHISVVGNRAEGLRFRIQRWDPPDTPVPSQVLWNIAPASPRAQRAEMERRLRDFLAAEAGTGGAGLEGGARLGLDTERYARAAQLLDAPPRPQLAGVLLDIGAILTVASIQYWLDPATNSRDWKLEPTLESLGRKITFQEAGFDDNEFFLNSGHALSGTGYYLSARARHLSPGQALVTSALAAGFWELSTEFRERMSINDLLLTPFGGLALGEAVFQLATFFRRSDDTWGNQLLADILSGPAYLAWGRDHSVPGGFRLLDERGFTARMWRRIHLFAGVGTLGAGLLPVRVGTALGFEASLIDRADYDRPGTHREWVWGPFASRLRVRLSLQGGLRKVSVLARTDYAGLYGQELHPGEGGISGLAGFAALGSFLEYESLRAAPADDALIAAGPVGPSLHLALHTGAVRIRVTAEAHPFFGQVLALGFPHHLSAGGGTAGAPEVLVRHGYYYTFGVRPSYRLLLEYRGAEAGLEHRGYELGSAEAISGSPSPPRPWLADHRRFWTVWLAHDLPLRNLRAVIEVERAVRSGEAGGQSISREDWQGLLRLDWRL